MPVFAPCFGPCFGDANPDAVCPQVKRSWRHPGLSWAKNHKLVVAGLRRIGVIWTLPTVTRDDALGNANHQRDGDAGPRGRGLARWVKETSGIAMTSEVGIDQTRKHG